MAANRFSVRWAVRQYELDQNGHVNNAVYLNWIEQVAADHVEALGMGRSWALGMDRAWVVREHHVTYREPLRYGDIVQVITIPVELSGARGVRRTEVRRVTDGALTTDAVSTWIWVRASDGRPMRIPRELIERFWSREARP